jgi:hypothetical protein
MLCLGMYSNVAAPKGHAAPAVLAGAAQLRATFNFSLFSTLHTVLPEISHGEPGQNSGVRMPSLNNQWSEQPDPGHHIQVL